MRGWLLAASLFTFGCNRAPIGAPQDLAATPDLAGSDGAAPDLAVASGDGALACPSGKIAFPQGEGCANDGSVEFCVPAGDAALVAQLKAIEPGVSCAAGVGRARCDPNTQLLCFFPTSGPQCTAPHGGLTDEYWKKLCDIAAFSEIKEIVHTFFE